MQTTQMEIEAQQTPAITAKQLKENKILLQTISKKITEQRPLFAVTIGRGSSDHACTYAKYLLETYFGIPTVSAAPSVLTIYGSELEVKNALVIGISQSGKSPDICQIMQSARHKGAITVAIVNAENSPLAAAAEFVIPMHAGEEKAVAATKSYIATLTTLAQLIAHLSDDQKLHECIKQLPNYLDQTLTQYWSAAIPLLTNVTDTLVLGRGYGFPIAQEAALKFKETCTIQAEAFSGAEVLHGPFALIKKNNPYLLFTQNDPSLDGMINLASKISNLGGKILLAAPIDCLEKINLEKNNSLLLSLPPSLHPICDPIMIIQAFYLMIAKLAVQRGFNPDKPDNLQKITETI
jgi:glutamine---fructose-6-phosphate transaminase (isomerizing)